MSDARTVRPLKILLVDDYADSAKTLGLALASFGHICHDFSDPNEALSQVATIRPDVCILDVVMPNISGYELARQIDDKLGYHPFTIAVSGRGEPLDLACGSVYGFTRHFLKPVEIQELVDYLEANCK